MNFKFMLYEKMLFYLYNNDFLSRKKNKNFLSAFAQYNHSTTAHCFKVSKLLEQYGLIERKREGRVVALYLTDLGRDFAKIINYKYLFVKKLEEIKNEKNKK